MENMLIMTQKEDRLVNMRQVLDVDIDSTSDSATYNITARMVGSIEIILGRYRGYDRTKWVLHQLFNNETDRFEMPLE